MTSYLSSIHWTPVWKANQFTDNLLLTGISSSINFTCFLQNPKKQLHEGEKKPPQVSNMEPKPMRDKHNSLFSLSHYPHRIDLKL